MEAEGETTDNVELFWGTFNEALQKIFRQKYNYFLTQLVGARTCPGAIISGITNIFGVDSQKRIKSCEFHFKGPEEQKSKASLDSESAEQFKSLCNMLLKCNN